MGPTGNEMTSDERTLILGALLHGLADYLRDSAADPGASFITGASDGFAHSVDVDLLHLLVGRGDINGLRPGAAESDVSYNGRAEILLSLLGRANSLALPESVLQSAEQGPPTAGTGMMETV